MLRVQTQKEAAQSQCKILSTARPLLGKIRLTGCHLLIPKLRQSKQPQLPIECVCFHSSSPREGDGTLSGSGCLRSFSDRYRHLGYAAL